MNFNWVAKNYQICFMTIKCYLKSNHVSFLIVNALTSFARILGAQPRTLKDFMKVFKLEMVS